MGDDMEHEIAHENGYDNDKDPLEYLPDREAEVMGGVLSIIEGTIADEDLRTTLVGTILVEIQEWGRKKTAFN